MRKTSLLLRVGIAMAVIIALGVVSMVSSVFIAENSEGFAAAINQAGTLRMQSYRIASSLSHRAFTPTDDSGDITFQLVEEFEGRLHSPRIHNVLSKGTDPSVHEAYHVVEEQWNKVMLPKLQAYLDIARATVVTMADRQQGEIYRDFYLNNVDQFVQKIHYFVKTLEIDAENKNEQLRMMQIVALILTLLVAIISIYLTKKTILTPLNNLLDCAKATRRGDFSVRSTHKSDDELGELGAAFNMMAEDLSKTYADLEARVKAKTADLERSNQSLELLYGITKRLSSAPPTVDVLEALIRDIEKVIDIRSGSICLGKPGDNRAYRLASINSSEVEQLRELPMDCEACLGDGSAHEVELEAGTDLKLKLYSIPIRDKDHQYGVLVVQLPLDSEEGIADWQRRLLNTVASHIAIAINMSEQVSQNRMVALLEERSVIARELHDSLAQSLSYLKIQVSRLEKSIIEDDAKEKTLMISDGLRKGLNGAYRQLRELLATFRLRISEEGLNAALEDTVREFRERSDIDIHLINQMGNCKFSPNAEIHVMHIVREALSNVIRHADATRATIYLECDMDGLVTILVEDNGIGIDDEHDMMHHYGLPIMKERAEWLGGTLEIGESAEGGTSVKLTFTVSNTEKSPTNEKLIQRMLHG